MDKKLEGAFSIGFFNLQLQLQRLLDDAGGERAIKLLDGLSDLDGSQREALLDCFLKVLERLPHLAPNAAAANGPEPGNTASEATALLRAILAATSPQSSDTAHFLELVRGGKDPLHAAQDKSPIDLAQARQARKANPSKPLVN